MMVVISSDLAYIEFLISRVDSGLRDVLFVLISGVGAGAFAGCPVAPNQRSETWHLGNFLFFFFKFNSKLFVFMGKRTKVEAVTRIPQNDSL